MKKLILICLLGLSACGGGSDDLGASGDLTAFDTSDFQGTYDYQDDNCSYPLINQFTVTQSGDNLSLVVVQAGLSGYSNGDTLSGDRVQDTDERYYADFYDETGCEGTFLDETEANDLSDYYGVIFLAEDLLIVCDDFDAIDEYCVAAYSKE